MFAAAPFTRWLFKALFPQKRFDFFLNSAYNPGQCVAKA